MENRIAVMVFATVVFFGCKKEDDAPAEPQLPPTSQSGANIFGCRIDGKVFKVEGTNDGFSGEGIFANLTTVNNGDSMIAIGAQDYGNKNSFLLKFQYRGIGANSSVSGEWPYTARYSNAEGTAPGNSNWYLSYGTGSGHVVVSHYDGLIAVGTFDIKVANGTGDTVQITDGRFDVRLD